MSDSLQPHWLQHARLPCPSLSPGVCSDSWPMSQWCHITNSSSVTPFSSCPQSFPASGSFPMSWLLAQGGESIGASVSAPVLPMNIQGLFPSGLTDWLSLLPKGRSRVFSSTIVQKHQFFGAQPSSNALLLLLLLLSRFSCVWLCATPQTVAHQAPPSLGFSRQEHRSGLPFPSPMHESEKWKWSHSVVFDS